jgi:hypothetical protein
MNDLEEAWKEKRKKMLDEKINVNDFFYDLFSHPEKLKMLVR